jgi:SAM-dependent methyltransferase
VNAPSALSRFRVAYGAHRASEGRGYAPAELRALPYLRSGPLAKQWAVRARTFDAFVAHVLHPAAHAIGRPPRVLDLGAGNGWLCWRASLENSPAVALDIRDDDVDGLGATTCYLDGGVARFERIVGTFQSLPLAAAQFDVVVFNASLHYATDLAVALGEARRVMRRGARVAILDSPFYERDIDGDAMVAEKRAGASRQFGSRADVLLSLPFIEYLTVGRLESASSGLGLAWRRHRVSYPVWYEARPIVARLRRKRTPSRFDLWVGTAE